MRKNLPLGCVVTLAPIPVSVTEYEFLKRFLNQACGNPLYDSLLKKWIEQDEELETQGFIDNLRLSSFFTQLYQSQADRLRQILTSLLVHLICSDDYGDDFFTAIDNTWDQIQNCFNPDNLVSVRVGEADYDFSLSSLAIAYGRDCVIKQLHNPDGGCQSFQDGECFLKACEIAITHIGTEAFYNVLIDLLFDGKITDPAQMRKIYERRRSTFVDANECEEACMRDFECVLGENNYALMTVIFDFLSPENKKHVISEVLRAPDSYAALNALLEGGLDLRLLIDVAITSSQFAFNLVLDALADNREENLLFIANLTLNAIEASVDSPEDQVESKKYYLNILSYKIRHCYSPDRGHHVERLNAYKQHHDPSASLAKLVEYALFNDRYLFDYLLGLDPALGATQDEEGCYIISKTPPTRDWEQPETFDLARVQMLLDKINRLWLCKFLISASYIVALLKAEKLTGVDRLGEWWSAGGHPNAADKIRTMGGDRGPDGLKFSVDVNNISVLQMLWFYLRSIFYSIFCCCAPTSTSASHTLFSGDSVAPTSQDNTADSTDADDERWDSSRGSVGDDDSSSSDIESVIQQNRFELI